MPEIIEGYTKFQLTLVPTPPPTPLTIAPINDIRTLLYKKGYIGAYPNGIGFGNVSIRYNRGFIISGTQTGSSISLTPHEYTFVSSWDIEKNYVTCEGEIAASSETLSHAALYESLPECQAILHIHSKELWGLWRHKLVTTDEKIAYGTPEMAHAIAQATKKHQENGGIIIMGGHEDGILLYGHNEKIAFEQLATLEKRG